MIRIVQNEILGERDFQLMKRGAPYVIPINTTIDFRFKKPSGAIVTKTATVIDAATGQIRVTFIAGDFNEIGYYYGETFVMLPGNVVIDNLEEPVIIYARAPYTRGKR